jgi:hypothetical protein
MALQTSSLPNTPRRDSYGAIGNRYTGTSSPQFLGGSIDPTTGNLIAGTRQGAETGGNAAAFTPPRPAETPSTTLAPPAAAPEADWTVDEHGNWMPRPATPATRLGQQTAITRHSMA